VGKHVDRKTPILRIALAIVLVDENRARQGERFLPVKRIVGEQYPAFFAYGKGSQALAAWSVTPRNVRVSGMTVARRLKCLPDSICDSVSDGYYTIGLHDLLIGETVCVVARAE